MRWNEQREINKIGKYMMCISRCLPYFTSDQTVSWPASRTSIDSRQPLLSTATFIPDLKPLPALPVPWVQTALANVVKRSGREADHSPLSSTEV